MKFTQQEKLFIGYLCSKSEAYWEELAQFCKNPQAVKLTTVQKVVSDIKKKYRENNTPLPFNCKLTSITNQSKQSLAKMTATNNTTDFNGQRLVQVKLNKKTVAVNVAEIPKSIPPSKVESAKIQDFSLRPFNRQVVTRTGIYSLNDEEFEIIQYLMVDVNRKRFVSLEELRDKVCYPKFGSKLPPRWFDAIQRRVNNIRQQIPETKKHLLTVRQEPFGGYIFN